MCILYFTNHYSSLSLIINRKELNFLSFVDDITYLEVSTFQAKFQHNAVVADCACVCMRVSECVCVCMCVCARACVCECV